MEQDEVSTWDGVTQRSGYKRRVIEGRDSLAQAARDGDWSAVFALLDEHPGWINSGRVGGGSGYALFTRPPGTAPRPASLTGWSPAAPGARCARLRESGRSTSLNAGDITISWHRSRR
ncbi:hypothetical protein ACFQ0B_02855 [Nonomuraea thailandensis]